MADDSDASPVVMEGRSVATEWREDLAAAVATLETNDVTPTLATVVMAADPASLRYVSLKHRDAADVGLDSRDVRIDPTEPGERVFDAIARLSDDPTVHGVFLQAPLQAGVDVIAARSRIDPRKDVEGLHPANLGRLVAGRAVFEPPTPMAIEALLAAYDIDPAGKDVVVVGRTDFVGKPIANRLLAERSGGNATVTVCHTASRDLASKTKGADILVTATGVPDLIDASMLAEGAVVVDVGATRIETEDGVTFVGDVDFESAVEKTAAVTPLPGGVGPVTRVALLSNTIEAASRQTGVNVDIPERF